MAALAARRVFGDEDRTLSEVCRRSQAAEFYTWEDFVLVCQWAKATKYSVFNSAQAIERESRVAFSTNSERERIGALMRLSGVWWLTASILLHFMFEDQYPTLARGALWSWGFDEKPDVNFEFWWAYVEACRTLASECRVNMRDLDRALRQFTTEQQGQHQPRPGTSRSGSAFMGC